MNHRLTQEAKLVPLLQHRCRSLRCHSMTGSTGSLRSNKKRFMVFLGLCVIVVLVSATTLYREVGKTAFHGDESGWTYAGYYYTNLLLQGDLDWQRWVCNFCGGFGYLNPHLGKWILGIPLQLESQNPLFLSDFQNWEKALKREKKIRAATAQEPPPNILLRARTSSVILGSLCCLSLLWIGYLSGNL